MLVKARSIESWVACCRGPPEKSVAKQPAGYQAVLKATLHEAAVTAACIASKAGLVALGDASGDLSVLNLCRVRLYLRSVFT